MADVTVVIPTHNRKVLLARTLRSVLAQEDVDLAVLVVDDGSADGTAASVAELGDARVEVIRHPEPRGVSAARNSGIARAGSPWLAFVDDDDLWAPRKLRAQLDALAAAPDAGWACTGSVDIDLRCQLSGWVLPPTEADLAARLLRENVIPGGGSGVLASRELTERVGGFDEAISNLADWDFYTRLALHAPMAAVPRLHLGYLVHPQGMAHNVPRSQVEYAYLDVKYGHERRRRGVELNRRDWLGYLARLAYRGGHRRTGVRLHADLVVREHQWRFLRPMVTGLVPERIRQVRGGRWVPPPPPPDLGSEAREWLAPYATAATS